MILTHRATARRRKKGSVWERKVTDTGGDREGEEKERQRGTQWAKHRITMAPLPVSSHVANAKLPYAGRHMNTHKRAHTQRQYTEAWSHAYRCIQCHIQCNIQCNILVTRCTWSDPFTLNHQSVLMVSMFSGCHWLDKGDHNNNDLKPWWQWLDRVDVGH